jgi:hypothetical protein
VEVDGVPAADARVRVAEGASGGLAALVAQYLEQVLENADTARRARAMRGRIAVTASDRGTSVTLQFDRGDIVVSDGVAEPVDAAVAAPFPALLDLLRGEGHPVRDHLRGRLRVRATPRGLLLPLRVHRLLRLPPAA